MTKSMTSLPSEYLLVEWLKKVVPYGEFETWPKPLGPSAFWVLPVSVKESPKAYILLKGLEDSSEYANEKSKKSV